MDHGFDLPAIGQRTVRRGMLDWSCRLLPYFRNSFRQAGGIILPHNFTEARVDKQEREDRMTTKRAKEAKRDILRSRTKLLGGGFVAGVLATLIIGFSTGNFITPSNAERMARNAANDAETAALVPYCVASFNESPDAARNLAALLKTSEWMRGQFISDGKWASDSGSRVHGACAEQLVTDANAAKGS